MLLSSPRCRLPVRIRSSQISTYSTKKRFYPKQDKDSADQEDDIVASYPYGPARWYKQSDKGLYGGQRIRFGNNVGPKSETKSRRTFEPNVQDRSVWSAALKRSVRLRTTTRVLRTLDKLGGLDEYLLGTKEARIRELGVYGWRLRNAVQQAKALEAEKAALARQLPDPVSPDGEEETLEVLDDIDQVDSEPQRSSKDERKPKRRLERVALKDTKANRRARRPLVGSSMRMALRPPPPPPLIE